MTPRKPKALIPTLAQGLIWSAACVIAISVGTVLFVLLAGWIFDLAIALGVPENKASFAASIAAALSMLSVFLLWVLILVNRMHGLCPRNPPDWRSAQKIEGLPRKSP